MMSDVAALEDQYLILALDELFHGGGRTFAVPDLLERISAAPHESEPGAATRLRRHYRSAFRRLAIAGAVVACLALTVMIVLSPSDPRTPPVTPQVPLPRGVIATEDARYEPSPDGTSLSIEAGWFIVGNDAPALNASGNVLERVQGAAVVTRGSTPGNEDLRARGPWLATNGITEDQMSKAEWIRAGTLAIWIVVGTAMIDGETLSAQPAGTPDITFGNGGVTVEAGSPEFYYQDGVIQPDGKIVAVGIGHTSGDTEQVVVARYHANGMLDPSFGNNGIARVVARPGGGIPQVRVVVASNDRIIVSAYRARRLIRLTPSGQLDSSFGSGGIVDVVSSFNWNRPGTPDPIIPTDFAIQSTGRIVVSGTATMNGKRDVYAVRLNANGKADTSFGTRGIAHLSLPGEQVNPLGTTTIDSLDRPMVTFWVSPSASVPEPQVRLVRFTANGQVDTSFGEGVGNQRTGMIKAPVFHANRVVIGPNNSVYLYGPSGTQAQSILVAGYTSTGDPVNGFGNAGLVEIQKWTGRGTDSIQSTIAAFDSYGRMIVSARIRDNLGTGEIQDEAYVLRLTPSGVIDYSFGTAGQSDAFILHRSDSGRNGILSSTGQVLIDGTARILIVSGGWISQTTSPNLTNTVGFVAAYNG